MKTVQETFSENDFRELSEALFAVHKNLQEGARQLEQSPPHGFKSIKFTYFPEGICPVQAWGRCELVNHGNIVEPLFFYYRKHRNTSIEFYQSNLEFDQKKMLDRMIRFALFYKSVDGTLPTYDVIVKKNCPTGKIDTPINNPQYVSELKYVSENHEDQHINKIYKQDSGVAVQAFIDSFTDVCKNINYAINTVIFPSLEYYSELEGGGEDQKQLFLELQTYCQNLK